MKKKVIICGDDFGYSFSINEAMINATSEGMLTDLSLITNAPGSTQAANFLKENKKIPAGLHFNFTSLKPLSPLSKVSSLIENGSFYKPDLSTWDFSFLEKTKQIEIKTELQTQIKWFENHVGRKPTHIISHKCESGDPKVLIPIVEACKTLKIPTRAPLWHWKENFGAQSYVRYEEVKTTNKVIVLGFWGGVNIDLIKNLDSITNSFTDGINELVAMPGYIGEKELELTTFNWQRAQIMEMLMNEDVQKYFKNSSKVKLISYPEL